MQILPNSKHPMLCMLWVLPALPGHRFSRPGYNKTLISSHSSRSLLFLFIFMQPTAYSEHDHSCPGQVKADSEFGATTTCGSQGTSSAALQGCFTSAAWASGRRVAFPAHPAVPKLHTVNGNWKQRCVFQRVPGSVIHYWSCTGEEGGADGASTQIFQPGRSLNLSLSKAASVPGMISCLVCAFLGSDFFTFRGHCLLTYGCGVSQTEIFLWDKLVPFLDGQFVHRQ